MEYEIDVKVSNWNRYKVESDLSLDEVKDLITKCDTFNQIKKSFDIKHFSNIDNTTEYMNIKQNTNRSTVELLDNNELITNNGRIL